MQVVLDGVPMLLAPEVRLTTDGRLQPRETLAGGAIVWQGTPRQTIRLEGRGLSVAARDQLEALVLNQNIGTLELGVESYAVLIRQVERQPTTGTERWTVIVDALVVSVG